MAGPSFTQTFGGTVLYPAQSTYNTIALTQSITLLWPTELSLAGAPVVADIMDVTASAPGFTISFSDATLASTGYTALFNNVGANTFTVLDSTGGVIAAIASGQAWLIYLADNSTAAGTWRIFQMGAGVSTANAAALAGAGLKAITTTLNAFVTIQTHNTNYVSTIADRAQMIEWTGGVGTITLGAAATLGTGWFCYVKNGGSGTVTVSPPSGTIDGQASVAFATNNSAIIVTDGANFFTIGFGQTINSIFNFLQINLTGLVSPLVLSGAQLNRVSYQFIGALTANFIVQVPSTVQQYWVDNETSGAFTLSFESPTPGTITTVAQGQRNILYCDGVNVVPAVTFGSTSFTNGTAAAPSVFFANSSHSGLYSPGVDQVAVTTTSTQRILVDNLGHVTVQSSDDSSASFNVFGPSGGFGPSMVISTPIGGVATSPNLQLKTTAAGGFCTLSLGAQGSTLGTSDLALLQQGTTLNGILINRASNATLSLQTTGASGTISIAPNGTGVLICSPPGTNAVQLGSNNTNSIGFLNLTASTATSGAATLPANPVGFLTVTVNGGTARIPYYAP